MFLLDDGAPIYSASDLTSAATCEFALLRAIDARLGRAEPLEPAEDAMLARTAALGDAHERRVLQQYRDSFGPWDPSAGAGVAEIQRPGRTLARRRAALEAMQDETLKILRTGADVVYQAGFFDGRFGGWADFLVRDRAAEGPGTGPVYAVYDTKLARHAKVTALLQLAAYADGLIAAGLTPARHVHLILGDHVTTDHRLADLLPVYRDRRARLELMLDTHLAVDAPVAWGDARYRACGRCEVCVPELTRTRDVLLVAGLRGTQRARLHGAGITTIDALAASSGAVDGVGVGALATLRAQARLQVQQTARATAAAGEVSFDLFAPDVVGKLPPPDAGDIFFDFEGDPLWAEDGSTDWGLEYLFGVVENPVEPGGAPLFRPFWAHDRVQEKQALVDFLAYVTDRRSTHPDLHVYHYAAYERTALLRLAGRHGVGEVALDNLLRGGVLVDLYATVRASLRVGQGSYSIKKLEPLYMAGGREGEVTNASASIVEYADACAVRDAGDVSGPDGFDVRLQRIADYNEYDCISTLRLRDWLLARAAEQGVHPGPGAPAQSPDAADDDAPEHDALSEALLAYAGASESVGSGPVPPRLADEQAVALLAASLGYHWREDKPFWWAHFDRLARDPSEWTEARGTFVADTVDVLADWAVPAGTHKNPRRRLRMVGRLEAGSDLRAGAKVCALYDDPIPPCAKTSVDGIRGWVDSAVVLSVVAGADGFPERDELIVEEALPRGATGYAAKPMALGPAAGPQTGPLRRAIRKLASDVLEKLAASPGELALPDHPALDLMRRVPPRTLSGRPLPTVGDGPSGYLDAITAALLDLDDSYLAVQGPPGTGKTYAGARVIAGLVARGWRIGVVAQSHAVVENMLVAVSAAGVPPDRIGKKRAPGTDPEPGSRWQWLTDTGYGAFYASNRAAHPGGYVVGGTSWDFTNPKKLPPDRLDLLVIDEAGQFCLANTVAVSGATRNLLLLGDPQQLPQVSQGKHPEPVDRSALGWLADGRETLPSELGYFLARTWRMHPALCGAVSRLAYEGRLSSMASTAARSLEGIEPGVREVLLKHVGNAVDSPEEAAEVVRQVRAVVGHRWRDPSTPGGEDRPLEPSDVLVVAAYNAQVWRVKGALAAAGLDAVRVGTVDKFQGQQAPVVIVTTAASSAEDVPRGMEFLLSRNRVNVAISRGKWCAIIVRSAALTDYLPLRPEALEELGAFIALAHPGVSVRTGASSAPTRTETIQR